MILGLYPYLVVNSYDINLIQNIDDTHVSKQFWHNEMFKVIKPVKKYVYRIHTDGFITSRKVDVEVGTELGQWKTKEGSCEVVNANVVHWDT